MKLVKLFGSLTIAVMLFQAVLPNGLLATSYTENKEISPTTIHELIEESDLIVMVKPTEIKLGGKNGRWGRLGGSAKVQVLEVWKGSLKKKEFAINWRAYNGVVDYLVFGDRIHGMAKHIMFLKEEGPRKRFYIGTYGESSFWPLQRIQFPGLEGSREAVAYQNAASYFYYDGTGQVLLRDTATKQTKNGEKVYRKAILLNEFRLFVKEVLGTLEVRN